MKRTLGLAMASGLALLIAGCSASGSVGSAPSAEGGGGGGAAAATGGARAAEPVRFNLAVRCPGVHYLVAKGKPKDEITAQLQVTEEQVAECERYVASQPKGFVPPPPPGYVPPPPKASGSAAATGSSGQQVQGGASASSNSSTSQKTQ